MLASKIEFETRQALETNLGALKVQLRSRQAPIVEPAPSTIEIFSKLPMAEQQVILANISTYVKILSQTFEPEIQRDPRTQEVARLKSAVKSFGMKATNSQVFEILASDDVVEVYNLQGIQLYRNVGFFKVCSYNLLDLSVHAWGSLYDKPKHVLESTFKIIERLFSSGDQPIAYEISTYLQKEKFEFVDSLKTLKVTPKFIVPLYDIASGQPSGAFSTYSAEVIADGSHSNRFNIL